MVVTRSLFKGPASMRQRTQNECAQAPPQQQRAEAEGHGQLILVELHEAARASGATRMRHERQPHGRAYHTASCAEMGTRAAKKESSPDIFADKNGRPVRPGESKSLGWSPLDLRPGGDVEAMACRHGIQVMDPGRHFRTQGQLSLSSFSANLFMGRSRNLVFIHGT